MPMNAKILGDAIAGALTHPQATPDIRLQIQNQWELIAGIIIAHIQATAIVNVPSLAVQGTAIVGSFGVPGPVVGTASGVGTIT